MSKKLIFEVGTKRIKTSDLQLYKKTQDDWKLSKTISIETQKILQLYKENNLINVLIDNNSPEFLKGYLDKKKMPSGSRITVLPNNHKLARGGFSLFAKNVKINPKYLENNCSWDVCYENSSGLKTYLYSEQKIHIEREAKTKLVNQFIRKYPDILDKLENNLLQSKSKNIIEYLALYTLIKTYMRVGNLEYYNQTGHKGLTTLQKKDIKIRLNDNIVEFNFIGKDGVPQHIMKEFPQKYIIPLQNHLDKIKKVDFVFTDINGLPLHSSIFSKILFRYTQKHFYPHIIRSCYADSECRKFIKNHKVATKNQVINKFKEIAENLGHKKYSKKKEDWIISYKVTIENYIRPEYVEKMKESYIR